MSTIERAQIDALASLPPAGSVSFRMQIPSGARDRIIIESRKQGLSSAAYVRMILMRHIRQLDAK